MCYTRYCRSCRGDMDGYTLAELADMHLVYGAAGGNGREAERQYRERFPNQRNPAHTMFARIDRRLRETGSLHVTKPASGSRRTIRTPSFEEEVLEQIQDTPSTAISRAIAHAMHTSRQSVALVLKEQLLRPYHVQKVQTLQEADCPARHAFCRWLLQCCENMPQFLQHVLFTGESCFTRDGLFNNRNTHVWADQHSHTTYPTRHQQRFSVNILAGILNDSVLGPHILPPRLNAAEYLRFLHDVLLDMLDDVRLDIRASLWFQCDGVTAHYALCVRDHLNRAFGQRWIGRGGPIAWPLHSPDLSLLDFNLWGHVKSLVYATSVHIRDELVGRIHAAFQTIGNTPAVFADVRRNLLRHCTACIGCSGGHFEQQM
ncbi:uncharacterized protein LOC134536611 [Bacillus rossius redtenbacheri]|uniref:uncharacterized protein LOC134536611 n=1 Tax=Bacillus rossius redtenbacheri TaxID=93214 RepID=UPI002FDDEAB8